MAEYTKIETARAIICDFCNQLYSDEPCEPADCDWLRMLEEDAANVALVVRCKDCKHHYDCGVHFCDRLGMDCPDDSDFFCSYGERKGGGVE